MAGSEASRDQPPETLRSTPKKRRPHPIQRKRPRTGPQGSERRIASSAVADASVLIWLAKAGRLDLLRKQYTKVLIPTEVYSEVVDEGLREGYADAQVVRDAVDQGWIIVEANIETRKSRLTEDLRDIHVGEASAILLALNKRFPLLMDESSGRAVAETLGLATRGILYVVLSALKEGELTASGARDTVSKLVHSGFRIEPSLLDRVLREICHYNTHA